MQGTAKPSVHPTEKILQKVGVFFCPGKVTAKTPRQPRKSPQLHHKKPPQNTPDFAKPPAKDHFDT
jgi:hypothetical protein